MSQLGGDAIHADRHAKELTLEAIAAELGLSVPYLCLVLCRERVLSRTRLAVLVEALGLNMQALLVIDACDRGHVDVSALTPAQVTEVVALAERLRTTATEDA